MLQIGGTESDAASKHFAGIKRQIQRTDEERREADHIQAVCAGAEKDRYGSIREEGHEKKNTDSLSACIFYCNCLCYHPGRCFWHAVLPGDNIWI